MTLPRFLDISQTLLQENAFAGQFGSETTFSFPMLAWRGGKLLDAMFLYRSGSGLPFAWTMLDSTTGKVLLMAERTTVDFAPDLPGELDPPLHLSLPQRLNDTEYTAYYKDLYEEYEQLRIIAFESDPTPVQRETIVRWRSLFTSIAFSEHLPYYQALSPEFFVWLGLDTPPAKRAGGRSAEPLSGEGQQAMLEAIQELSGLFQDKIANDRYKNQLFDEMHTELQQYKNGMLEQMSEPLERDVIKVIEDVERSIESHRGRIPTRENYDRFFSLFEGLQTDLKDLLFRHGVEPFSVPGKQVDIQRQQILATTPTSDPALDKTVAQRHTLGWEKAGRVIKPERVTVYIHNDSIEEIGDII